MRDHLIGVKKQSLPLMKYSQLLKLISTDSDETIISSDNFDYFGFMSLLDLIIAGLGNATCKICDKIYKAGQLKEFANRTW